MIRSEYAANQALEQSTNVHIGATFAAPAVRRQYKKPSILARILAALGF